MKHSLLAAAMMLAASASFADYRVGIHTSDITPTLAEGFASCMGGYGGPYSRCGITAVHDSITVRSMYVADQETETIFVSVDSVGLGDSLIQGVKDFTSTFTGIPKSHIFVSATHTHSGPDLQGLWGGVDPLYKNRVLSSAVSSAMMAIIFSEESELYISESNADVANRRGHVDVDDKVSSLLFKSSKTGQPTAILLNMSAHPVILDKSNTEYSSDFVHYFREHVERNIGVNSIFINGIVGDAMPIDPASNGIARSFSFAQQYGTSLGEQVLAQLPYAKPVTAGLTVDAFEYRHPVTNEGLLFLNTVGLLDANIDQDNHISASVAKINFGDTVTMVTAPGELMTSIGRDVQSGLGNQYNLVLGLTNASYGYFIPSEEYGSVPGRVSEEQTSIDQFAGDTFRADVINFLAPR